jgi:hypothetical protein
VAGNRHPVAGHHRPAQPTLEVKLRDALRAELRVIIIIGHVVRLHDVLLGGAHRAVLVAAELALPDALVVPELVRRLVRLAVRGAVVVLHVARLVLLQLHVVRVLEVLAHGQPVAGDAFLAELARVVHVYEAGIPVLLLVLVNGDLMNGMVRKLLVHHYFQNYFVTAKFQ